MPADNVIHLRRRSFIERLLRFPKTAYLHFQLLGKYRKYPLPLHRRITVSLRFAATILR